MVDKRLRLLVEAVTSDAQQKLRSFGNAIKQFGDQAGRSLDKPTRAAGELGGQLTSLATVAKVALTAIAVQYGRMAADSIVSAAEMAAANLAIADSFQAVAIEYGLSSSKILEAIDRASRSTIDKYSAMAAASTAMRLGVATDIKEFEDLMKIAYMRARETGVGVEEAWGWITRGIGRASPFILDNLNFLVSSTDVLDDYAAGLGKSADELNKVQKQEALRSYVLEQGAGDLERWNEMGEQGIDVFDRYRAKMAEFRQELTEKTLPAVTTVLEELTKLPTILDQIGYIIGVNAARVRGSLEDVGRAIREGDWAGILQGETKAAGEAAMRAYALQDAARKANDEWGEMHQISAAARKGLRDVGGALDDTTEDLEEQEKALKKGAAIWSDYLRDVAEKNWDFARKVEDAQFSMRQAAEKAMFDLMQIERDAGDRRGDLLETAAIRAEADTARHYDKLRYMKQDLMDELADMEWDYQQERRQLLDRAPWWIRQALSKEFAERERIAGTGDTKALEQFDQNLKERIKAIDPVYARELDLLEDRYEHQEDIERRESRQSLDREKDAWRISSREQERSLHQQLRELDRNLQQRLQEWHFHQGQREESERWSMSRMITEHKHSLSVMYDNTQRKLAEIVPLWEHYGREYIMALIRGMATGQMFTPVPAGGYLPLPPTAPPFPTRLQRGMEYVPTTMPAVLHRGEAVLPAPEAQRYREGAGGVTVIIENVNLYGAGFGPAQGRRFARDMAEQLGPMIRQQTR